MVIMRMKTYHAVHVLDDEVLHEPRGLVQRLGLVAKAEHHVLD